MKGGTGYILLRKLLTTDVKNNATYDYSYGNQTMNEYIHKRQPLFLLFPFF